MKGEKEIEAEIERIEEQIRLVENTELNLDTKILTFTWVSWAFVVFGALVALFGIVVYINAKTDGSYSLNLLGDYMAGTVASIWSLAGLFFIYVAFLGQKQQLQHQRIEIKYSQIDVKYTRLELKGQKEEMATQNSTLRQQRFENTLFQMISIHHELVDKMSFGGSTNKTEKRAFLSAARTNLGNSVLPLITVLREDSKMVQTYNPHNEDEGKQQMQAGYKIFYKEIFGNALSHYFRNLYHIFKFIYRSNLIPNESKQFYASLVRAQLSPDELYLILYNSMVDGLGNPNFLFLIREFDLMQNFDFSPLDDCPFHKEAFEAEKAAAMPEWTIEETNPTQ